MHPAIEAAIWIIPWFIIAVSWFTIAALTIGNP